MVRQAQHYFAAAVSAAVLNGAAVAVCVVFALLSSVQGFPLLGLPGAEQLVAPSSSAASGTGRAAPGDAFLRGGGLPLTGARGAEPGTANRDGSDSTGVTRDADSESGDSPSGTQGSAPGPAPGGTGGPTDPGSQDPATPAAPAVPAGSQPPRVLQQVGTAVSSLPSTLNQGVNTTVDTADTALGGLGSATGLSQTVKGASGALLGPDSVVDKTAGAVGGALQGRPPGG